MNAQYQMHCRSRELANPSRPPLYPTVHIDMDTLSQSFTRYRHIISYQLQAYHMLNASLVCMCSGMYWYAMYLKLPLVINPSLVYVVAIYVHTCTTTAPRTHDTTPCQLESSLKIMYMCNRIVYGLISSVGRALVR